MQGSFEKQGNAPVLGDKETGTLFDPFVRPLPDGRLRMDVSWRPRGSVAVSFSDDGGRRWTPPAVTLGPNPSSGWEQIVNRDCVLPDPSGDGYLMWYTGQVWDGARGRSWIGMARSRDGLRFERFRETPVLSPETPFEKETVMNPFVMAEGGRFRMWYAAGETYEPDVICHAESDDGVHWRKSARNPVFACNPAREWERERVGAVDVVREEGGGYLMFYIGYRDVHTACVCAARSPDGVSGWERVPENPLVVPAPGAWDADSCYKPTVVADGGGAYRLWYNGRRGGDEFIGLASGRLRLMTRRERT